MRAGETRATHTWFPAHPLNEQFQARAGTNGLKPQRNPPAPRGFSFSFWASLSFFFFKIKNIHIYSPSGIGFCGFSRSKIAAASAAPPSAPPRSVGGTAAPPGILSPQKGEDVWRGGGRTELLEKSVIEQKWIKNEHTSAGNERIKREERVSAFVCAGVCVCETRKRRAGDMCRQRKHSTRLITEKNKKETYFNNYFSMVQPCFAITAALVWHWCAPGKHTTVDETGAVTLASHVYSLSK